MTDELAYAISKAARIEGPYVLRSGQIASHYFDKYRIQADPTLLKRLTPRMLALLPPGTEVLAGLELGGVPIATAMSIESGLPLAFVRRKHKAYGTRQLIEGLPVSGRKVVIVEDVISTGATAADAAAQLRAADAVPLAVVCAIWRGTGSPKIPGLEDVPVFTVFNECDLDPDAG